MLKTVFQTKFRLQLRNPGLTHTYMLFLFGQISQRLHRVDARVTEENVQFFTFRYGLINQPSRDVAVQIMPFSSPQVLRCHLWPA